MLLENAETVLLETSLASAQTQINCRGVATSRYDSFKFNFSNYYSNLHAVQCNYMVQAQWSVDGKTKNQLVLVLNRNCVLRCFSIWGFFRLEGGFRNHRLINQILLRRKLFKCMVWTKTIPLKHNMKRSIKYHQYAFYHDVIVNIFQDHGCLKSF